MYSDKTPDDGQKNCPKHVEFYSKNEFEELVHLVGFIITIYIGHFLITYLLITEAQDSGYVLSSLRRKVGENC